MRRPSFSALNRSRSGWSEPSKSVMFTRPALDWQPATAKNMAMLKRRRFICRKRLVSGRHEAGSTRPYFSSTDQ
jgi:hypothetical protein